MAEKKDVDWDAAAKRYRETDIGKGKLSEELGVSKALVVRKLKNVQKNVGVPLAKNAAKLTLPDGVVGNPIFTENAVSSPKQSPGVTGVTDQTSGQVGDVYRMPALAAPTPVAGSAVGLFPTPSHESAVFKIAEPPADLGIIERLDWVHREFNVLEQRLGDRHETERRALQNDFAVEMTKGVRTDRGPSLRLKALTEALAARQDMQRAALEKYRETRLKEYAGVYSSSLVIVAVLVPGLSFTKPNSTFDLARRARQAVDFYAEAAAEAEAAADAENVDWRDVPERAEPEEPHTVDVDAIEVTGPVSGTVYEARQ
jgi:hypothetical protein